MDRRSIPTEDLQLWWDCGWAYVMPDFDNANHSVIEWLADSAPRVPAVNRVQSTPDQMRGDNAA